MRLFINPQHTNSIYNDHDFNLFKFMYSPDFAVHHIAYENLTALEKELKIITNTSKLKFTDIYIYNEDFQEIFFIDNIIKTNRFLRSLPCVIAYNRKQH